VILLFTWSLSDYFPQKIHLSYAAVTLVTSGAIKNSTTNGGNITLTFPAGIAQGDVVILYGGHPFRSGAAIGPSTAGYTQIVLNNAAAPGFGVWYKVMGSTPDTTVVGQGTGNALDATAYAAFILRGANTSSLFDQTTTTAGPTTSTNPDAPAITTQTNGAWVLDLAGSQVVDTSPGSVTGYSNANTASGNDSNDISIAGATKEVATAGTENPAAWSAWSSGAWFAVTVALKPVTIPTVTTQAVSAIKDATATANGTITDTGGGNADSEGFVYDTATKSLPGNVAPASSGYASVASNTGSFGAGAFTVNLTGLTGGTTYFGRAYTHNAAGYSYGSEVSFTTAVVSISITSDGSISYGIVALNTSKDTTASGLNDTQTVQNNGTAAEDFSIKGQNTSCPWTLAGTTGVDQYVHAFSTNSGTNWTALTTNYQNLITNIAANGTQNFDLRLTTPSSTNCYTQQSVDVSIQAVAH
jgi:hypothetical protein